MPEGVNESGSFATITLLEDRALTGDPAANESEAYGVGSPMLQIELIISYQCGSGETNNVASVRLLLSEDGVNFRPYSIAQDGTPSGGVVESSLNERRFTVTAPDDSAPAERWFAVPTAAKKFKVQAAESGVATNTGTITVKARLCNVANQ